jgi:hypothetical protein
MECIFLHETVENHFSSDVELESLETFSETMALSFLLSAFSFLSLNFGLSPDA